MAEKTRSGNNLVYIAIILIVLIMIIFLVSRKNQAQDKTVTEKPQQVQLWNQNDFENWFFYLQDSTADPMDVFTVRDGKIHILGTPFGYMRTKDAYSDYRLHVEWRWPGEPGNSGVLLHIQEPDTIWPALFECQLRSGKAGDLVFLGGTDARGRTDKSRIVLPKSGESTEKPAGEWNAYDIITRNDSIIVYVNGTLQNTVTGPSVSEGHIGMQSEGMPIEFRNVYILQYR